MADSGSVSNVQGTGRVLLRGRIDFLIPADTSEGLGADLAVTTPWTQWGFGETYRGRKKFSIEINPEVNFLSRWKEDQKFFGGGGGQVRFNSNAFCYKGFCFLNSLKTSGGYGYDGKDGNPYFNVNLGLAAYKWDGPIQNFGVSGGMTYYKRPQPTTGIDFSILLYRSKPKLSLPVLKTPPDAKDFKEIDPKDYFTPVGDYKPGRVTLLYYAIGLQDKDGKPLGEPISVEDRKKLIEHDRQFSFQIKDSPLRGVGNKVNIFISKQEIPVRIQGKINPEEKASEVVDVNQYHGFVQKLVQAHPEYFGSEVQAIAQIPADMRDQWTWFRFDKVASITQAATSAWNNKDWGKFLTQIPTILGDSKDTERATHNLFKSMISIKGPDAFLEVIFPKLSIPMGWHAAGTKDFKIDLNPRPDVGVPHSSVVLFHELFGHGGTRTVAMECRAFDEYAEGSVEKFLEENPREKAVVDFLGQTLDMKTILSELIKKAPNNPFKKTLELALKNISSGAPKINVATLLTRANMVKKIVGKPLGYPNVLPDDPIEIANVWGKIFNLKERIWKPGSAETPKEGDVQIVPGGLYFPGRPFVRLKVFKNGVWRNTYMKESDNPSAPVGPVMEHCLKKTRDMIKLNSGD